MCEFKDNALGFSCGNTQYFKKHIAAEMIGVHPDTLGRLYLQSGVTKNDRSGLKLEALYFTEAHLANLGYQIIKEVTA